MWLGALGIDGGLLQRQLGRPGHFRDMARLVRPCAKGGSGSERLRSRRSRLCELACLGARMVAWLMNAAEGAPRAGKEQSLVAVQSRD